MLCNLTLILLIQFRPRHSEKIFSGKEVMGFTMDKKAIKDDDYANDTFESDSDDNHLGHENVRDKNESNPSETGTYTVDKEDDSPASAQVLHIAHVTHAKMCNITDLMGNDVSMDHYVRTCPHF